MPHFFANPSKSSKPDLKNNFFQNYADHLEFLHQKFKDKYDGFMGEKTVDMKLAILKNEALERLSIFEKIRDGHDYFDEVVGATAIPAMGAIVSLCSLAMAIWDAGQALAIKAGFVKDDEINHKDNAIDHLLLSAAALALSVASFVKSMIALVTRPIVTAIQGFAEQDEDRFHHSDSAGSSFLN